MFQSGFIADRNRISAPGRSGTRTGKPLVARQLADRPPTMWRTCCLASSSSVRSSVGKPCPPNRSAIAAASSRSVTWTADEHVRLLAVGDAVVELGDAAAADSSQNRRKLPRSSGIVTANTASRASPTSARSATNRSRSKFMFAPHATATSVASAQPSRAAYCLEPRHRQRAGRLEDAAGVLEHVLDRRAHRVGVDHARSRRRARGHSRNVSSPTCLHRGAVGEQADVLELHPLPGRQRPGHRIGVARSGPR